MEHQSPHGGSDRAGQALAPDTIVAAATPPGRGGVAIVRISGGGVPAMLQPLLGGEPAPRSATRAVFRDATGAPVDAGLALYFPAPRSYTGEPVLELHAHGGPVLVEALIGCVLALGARRAQPGEFTQRAFLNGKLDLAQAEAVASLIDASSTAAARAALRSLEGEFSRRVLALAEQLGGLRAWVEAGIDFADEPIAVLSDQRLEQRLQAALADLHALQGASRRGRALTEGLTVVIAGRPNAGKSTLLNRLAGHEAAIVSDTPGTTRDVVRERLLLDGVPLQVLDTAGLRCARDLARDEIEREGMRRAQAAMAAADRVLFVIDAAADPAAQAFLQERAALPAGVPVTLVFNKLDRLPAAAPPTSSTPRQAPHCLYLSALTGLGMEALIAHLKLCAGLGEPADAAGGVLAARARHLEALARVQTHAEQARILLAQRRAPELIAEELRLAQRVLGEIVGEESTEALLGRIFATFCIGK